MTLDRIANHQLTVTLMTSGTHQTRRVVLLMHPAERMLTGIGRYAESTGHWAFSLLPPVPESLHELHETLPHGLIADIHDADLATHLAGLGCPAVNVSGALRTDGIARVCCDNLAAGVLAAEHFLDRGFRHFAFVGDGRTLCSRQRESGFRRHLREVGYEPDSLHVPRPLYPACTGRRRLNDREDLYRTAAQWLSALPSGTAVLACDDDLGWQIAEIAAEKEIPIPDRLAVLGVGDQAMCRICRPPLSSIQPPVEGIGFVAAELLDDHMRGDRSRTDLVIAPLGVANRPSTDVMRVQDDRLAAGLRFIRNHYTDPIHVADVAGAAGMKRRTLEKHFREALGRTPAEEIRRLRIEAARSLLATSDLPVEEVASRSGFGSRRWLNAVLSKTTGLTPSAYRQFVRGAD